MQTGQFDKHPIPRLSNQEYFILPKSLLNHLEDVRLDFSRQDYLSLLIGVIQTNAEYDETYSDIIV